MSVELHLPDLPEVPISLGPPDSPRPHVVMPWYLRLRDGLSTYLPLLLMALLALATAWLVKNAPRPPVAEAPRAVSRDPDYTMQRFVLERFEADGRLKMRVEGEQLRHFPATDRIEIEAAVIRAISPDGRVTKALARLAIGSGDGSELQLLGGAEIVSERAGAPPLVMRGEFLHAFFLTEQVRSHLPVEVQNGARTLRASGLDYDYPTRRLELKGPLRVVLPGAGAAAP